jgi:phosphoglycerol transferase MdoB-like AlkP superfamily enzyme
MLSIPPTPGQSIVRRPGGTGVFNLGTIFRSRHYTTSFIYGGYSVFDNMGAFFSGNGFETIDQANFPKKEIHFSNAWGVSDEDLFRQAIKKADLDHGQGKKFFQYILTTSNHRPFTYPEGKIDIPSHTNREGAVKYSDYAIGEFIREAQKKAWFKDTIFVSARCAASRGNGF